MTGGGLKNAPELAGRLGLSGAPELLLVDVPGPLERLLAAERPEQAPPRSVGARALRSVKPRFPAIVLWREQRAGSQAILQAAVKRLEEDGLLWVVIANRKVIGPQTPANRRLDAGDLGRALSPAGLVEDGQVRVSAWHVAHRFRRQSVRVPSEQMLRKPKSETDPGEPALSPRRGRSDPPRGSNARRDRP